MCYYNGQKVTRAEKIRLLDLEKTLAEYDFLNRIIIGGFDYGNHTVWRPSGKDSADLVQMEWGFRPSWLKTEAQVFHFRKGGVNPSTGKYEMPITTLNAIGGEVLDKRMYKDDVRKNRCVVISSGFYEWRHYYPISKKTGKPLKTPVKYPYFIHLPAKEYFYMAGFYNNWKSGETGEIIQSSTIMTAQANELMIQVHNDKKRMPVILTEELAHEWMFGNIDDTRLVEIATTQHPYEEMYAYSLDKDFLNAKDPTRRVNHPGLPPIPLPQYEKEEFLFGDNDFLQGTLFG